jgi:hypothetical protein
MLLPNAGDWQSEKQCSSVTPASPNQMPRKLRRRSVLSKRPAARSCSRKRHPAAELHRRLDQLRAGDTLVVWKLDRLSRSLKDLVIILERIDLAGAKFRPLTKAIDTSGPRWSHADADAGGVRRV